MVPAHSSLGYTHIIKSALNHCTNEVSQLEEKATDTLSTKLLGESNPVFTICSKLLSYTAEHDVHCALDFIARRLDVQPVADTEAAKHSAVSSENLPSNRQQQQMVSARTSISAPGIGLDTNTAADVLPSCTQEGVCLYTSGKCGAVTHALELTLTHGSQSGECFIAVLMMANSPH